MRGFASASTVDPNTGGGGDPSRAAAAAAAAPLPPPPPLLRVSDLGTDVITTPIFYVNAAPHIGHLYTALLGDARARWSRLLGRRVLFTTGTDEHGLKIEEAAQRGGFAASTKEFCDAVSCSFVRCFEAFAISHDDFVRTTEPRHAETVRALWRRLHAQGAIYLGTHRGWYCKSDESYLTEAQTLLLEEQEEEEEEHEEEHEGEIEQIRETKKKTRRVSAESGHPVEYFEERNFMFRLSAYQAPLLEWLEQATAPFAR
jgi:methionyl-tRNA synthetase